MNEEKKTIALFNDSFPPLMDGVANTVVNYANIIERELGHAFVVTPDAGGADDSAFPFPVYRYPSIDIRKQIGYYLGLPVTQKIRRAIISENPDLVHVHCPTVSALMSRALREKLDVPTVFTYHTRFDIEVKRMTPIKVAQEAMMKGMVEIISSFDEVWTVSKGAADSLKSLGFDQNIVIMRNGCDVEKGRLSEAEVRAYTDAYDLPKNLPVFLFVGRMYRYKNQFLILEALKMLSESGVDFRMVFIGDGKDLPAFQKFVEENALRKKVFFTGPIRDRKAIRAFYSRADLFLFPSTYDTNGIVVTEAAGAETASVLVRGSAAAEGVTDRKNGFLIEESAESLFALLKEIAARPALLKEVGVRASEEIYLSWDDAVKAAYGRYSELIVAYRAGELKKHADFLDKVFDANGLMMDNMIKLTDLAKRIRDKGVLYLEDYFEEFEKNK